MAFNYFAQQKQQNNPNERQQAVQQQQVTQPVTLPSQPQQTPVAKPQPTLPAIDPNSDTAGMDALSSMVTTPQEEERMRKASVANRRIMAVADALRHIGNIYNTVNYAPAQQFNNPVQEEQQRYEKGKALRDAANVKYYTYQQAKAAQDAKARQWQADFNLKVANAAAQEQYRRDQLKEQGRFHDLNYQLGVRRADDAKAGREAALKETRRYHDITAGQRSQSLKMQRERTDAYVKKVNSVGGGGSGSSFPLKTPYGRMLAPGKSIPQPQMNQAYADFENNGWIPKNEWQKVMATLPLGSNETPDYVRNRLVAEAMANNGMAADYMRDNFNFRYENDTRGSGQYLMDAHNQTPYLGYTPDWRGGKNLGLGIGMQQSNNEGKKLGLNL